MAKLLENPLVWIGAIIVIFLLYNNAQSQAISPFGCDYPNELNCCGIGQEFCTSNNAVLTNQMGWCENQGLSCNMGTGCFTCGGSGQSSTRNVPSSVAGGSTFTVTYTAIGMGTGRWGLIIDDTVSGGCSFPSGTTYQDVLLSDSGNSRTVTVTAPSSGSCVFRGNYMYDENVGEIDYPDKTVSITGGGGCSLFNPDACTHVGKMCMDAAILCNDAFWYDGGYYCEDVDETVCSDGCVNDACAGGGTTDCSNPHAQNGWEFCGLDELASPDADPYRCVNSVWTKIDNCASDEVCVEYDVTSAYCDPESWQYCYNSGTLNCIKCDSGGYPTYDECYEKEHKCYCIVNDACVERSGDTCTTGTLECVSSSQGLDDAKGDCETLLVDEESCVPAGQSCNLFSWCCNGQCKNNICVTTTPIRDTNCAVEGEEVMKEGWGKDIINFVQQKTGVTSSRYKTECCTGEDGEELVPTEYTKIDIPWQLTLLTGIGDVKGLKCEPAGICGKINFLGDIMGDEKFGCIASLMVLLMAFGVVARMAGVGS